MGETKKYVTDDITILWKPELCIHSGLCARHLPQVFKPKERPWVQPTNATTEELIHQIGQCPSGALSYYKNEDGPPKATDASALTTVEIMANGPLLIHGACTIKNADGSSEVKDKTTALCRCGASTNKPYCDGTHSKIDFVG